MKVYQAFVQNRRLLADPMHRERAEQRQEALLALLPSGSGFDIGTEFVRCDDSVIVFTTEFHHMNEHGWYTGWTGHTVRIKASLMFGIAVTVSGLNRNGIKDYIGEVFANVMTDDFDWMAFDKCPTDRAEQKEAS